MPSQIMTPAQQKVVDAMHKFGETGLFSDRIKHQEAILAANMSPMEPIMNAEILKNILRLEKDNAMHNERRNLVKEEVKKVMNDNEALTDEIKISNDASLETKQDVIDIINSENSGISHQQRLALIERLLTKQP